MLWQFNSYIFCKPADSQPLDWNIYVPVRKKNHHLLRSILTGEACLDKPFVLNVNREQRPLRNAVKKI